MNARDITMILALAALAAVAACGRVSAPATPVGAIYPRVYPASAALLTGGNQRAVVAPPATSGPMFTAAGNYIDPAVRLPRVDPYADQQAAFGAVSTNLLSGVPGTPPGQAGLEAPP